MNRIVNSENSICTLLQDCEVWFGAWMQRLQQLGDVATGLHTSLAALPSPATDWSKIPHIPLTVSVCLKHITVCVCARAFVLHVVVFAACTRFDVCQSLTSGVFRGRATVRSPFGRTMALLMDPAGSPPSDPRYRLALCALAMPPLCQILNTPLNLAAHKIHIFHKEYFAVCRKFVRLYIKRKKIFLW